MHMCYNLTQVFAGSKTGITYNSYNTHMGYFIILEIITHSAF